MFVRVYYSRNRTLRFLSWKSERFQILYSDSVGSSTFLTLLVSLISAVLKHSAQARAVWEKAKRSREIDNVGSGWVIGERLDWVMIVWSCVHLTSLEE